MGLKAKDLAVYESKTLKEVFEKGDYVAIDLSPFIYKYFFLSLSTYDAQVNLQKEKKIIVTGHIYGLLKLLKRYRDCGVTPILCVDCSRIPLKEMTQKERFEQKQKKVNECIKNAKNEREMELSLLYARGPSPEDKKRLYNILYLAGYKVYSEVGVEAERLCGYLKENNYVQHVVTPDSDALLFNDVTIQSVDFFKDRLIVLNQKETLKKHDLDRQELIDVAIAAGTDYSKGLKNVGHVKALQMAKKDLAKFRTSLKEGIEYYDQIKSVFYDPLEVSSALKQDLKNIREPISKEEEETKKKIFVKSLEELGFSQNTIVSLT